MYETTVTVVTLAVTFSGGSDVVLVLVILVAWVVLVAVILGVVVLLAGVEIVGATVLVF